LIAVVRLQRVGDDSLAGHIITLPETDAGNAVERRVDFLHRGLEGRTYGELEL